MLLTFCDSLVPLWHFCLTFEFEISYNKKKTLYKTNTKQKKIAAKSDSAAGSVTTTAKNQQSDTLFPPCRLQNKQNANASARVRNGKSDRDEKMKARGKN